MSGNEEHVSKAGEIEIGSEPQFERILQKVLATNKEDSDKQLAKFQASNAARHKKRREHPS
jgi:hypothetical protein